MHPHSHRSVVPAEVRQGTLTRHAAGRFEHGRVYAISSGMGRPRLWSWATRAVLEGFAEGLEAAEGRDGLALLHFAAERARAALVSACNRLIERQVPDATLLAVAIDHEGAHVLVAGEDRAYLHAKKGQPQRLTPREPSRAGLLEGDTFTTTQPVHPGDLILAGSASAFSTSSVGRVASVLQSDPKAPPSVLAGLLTDPARKAGVGAAAVALRLR
ncbi:MAG TPA: hypothetical protein RMH85_15350 [Polyangiaceae bacterium LLY-WYZ-15_(1-7)]|nr:hypothetical protein [Sandaracinus sp.]HJL01727.1 hypothetical protein [Polyangiaceae bacterium LLY-WYZ-15_(1-7)]HJL09875.1 hypothetical protein [Polyangiaceae bacterium LLY-WYZ-15_(1-7)]HJL22048.1 hypothetical protein [Polyangiaceae bacterium LLY-WYZ-15_(1-7)]HJL36272.1 hypothetical protein [Polyangiaceae bacterium LLY-WYZ-15_(1-7)]